MSYQSRDIKCISVQLEQFQNKIYKPGKWRLIVDLSSPAGASVNDGYHHLKYIFSFSAVDSLKRRLAAAGHLVPLPQLHQGLGHLPGDLLSLQISIFVSFPAA